MKYEPDRPRPQPSAPVDADADAQARLAAIVEFSLDAIIGEDLSGLVTSWNVGAQATFGYTASEMIGTSITRLIPADRRDEEKELLDRLLQNERVAQLETIRLTKDGRLIDVSVTVSPILDRGGRIVGSSKVARDITAQKCNERELARMSRLYAALSHINQAIVWTPTRDELLHKVCRVLVQQGDLQMAWIGWDDPQSRRLVPVAQYGDDDGYLQRIEVYTDDRPKGRGPSGTAVRTGGPYISNDLLDDPASAPWRLEMQRSRFQACAAFPIRSGGAVCGALTVFSGQRNFFHDKEIALLAEAAGDLSFALDNFAKDEARRLAEQKARDEVLFSSTMLDSMPGVVYLYDMTGRFLRWNQNFEVVTGYAAEQIATMHPLDFFTPDDRPTVQRRIADVFTTGESSVEANFVASDGRATPYFFTGRRTQFQGRTCLVGVGVDITERAKLTAEREARHRAEAADLIKSAFLATMSHELRTPLNSIIGFTGIILKGLAGPLNDEQTLQLGMVRSSARHLLALVNDVLDISKIEAGQLAIASQRFDLRRAIDKVISLVTPQAQAKQLLLVVRAVPELGEAESDQRRFEQILLNLLSNAVKFSDAGEITLCAELTADSTAIRLCVSDTGIGIKPEHLSGLFQPFRQVDSGLSRSHEGTGLGLAICHRLASLMGGEITAESEWGKGSSFTVTLPLRLPSKTPGLS